MKQQLYNYRNIKKNINFINDELCKLTSLINCHSCIKCSSASATYCEQYKIYNDELQQLFKHQNEINRMLNCMSELEREIITLKFIEKYSWTNVSLLINYSESHCKRIGKAAINKMIYK